MNLGSFSVVVSYEDIAKKNYSLSAGQYFEIKIEYVDISKEDFNAFIKSFENKIPNSSLPVCPIKEQLPPNELKPTAVFAALPPEIVIGFFI